MSFEIEETSSEAKSPKFLAPYTCPECGCLDYDELMTRDSSNSVGSMCRCLECGTQYTHWSNLDYKPYGVEVHGVTYEYPSPPSAESLAHMAISVDYDRLDTQIGALSRALSATGDGDDAAMLESLLGLARTVYEQRPFPAAAVGKGGDHE